MSTDKITLELTSLELTALRSMCLDRFMDKAGDSTLQWEDLITQEVVTVETLLARLIAAGESPAMYREGLPLTSSIDQLRACGRVRRNPLERYYIANRFAEGFAWTGSTWEAHTHGIGHDAQISNFSSREEALRYAEQAGIRIDE